MTIDALFTNVAVILRVFCKWLATKEFVEHCGQSGERVAVNDVSRSD